MGGILALTMLAGNTTYIPRFSVVFTHGRGDDEGVAVSVIIAVLLLSPPSPSLATATLPQKGCVHNLALVP